MPRAIQGLDGLCGVYSLVNVFNVLHCANCDHNAALFKYLCECIPKRYFRDTVINGMNSQSLINLANRFIKYCENLDSNITFAPLLGENNVNKAGFFGELRGFLCAQGITRPRAVLVGIEGSINHWSVVYECKQRVMGMWDSGNMKTIRYKDLGVGNHAHMPYTIVRNEVWGFRFEGS